MDGRPAEPSQYVPQYLLFLAAGQLQPGCAHFSSFFSGIRATFASVCVSHPSGDTQPLAPKGLRRFEGDRVARHQSLEKCLALLLRGTTVALRGIVERFEQFVPALLMGTANEKLVEQHFYGLIVRDVYWCVYRAIEYVRIGQCDSYFRSELSRLGKC